MPVGCPTCVTDKDALEQLPLELASSAVVVSSGEELLLVIQGSR